MFKQKLLGAAFAACDLMFEVDGRGLITFALGSTQGLAAKTDGALEGQCWRNLFGVDDQPLLEALLRGVGPAERKGPLGVTLTPEAPEAPGRPATLSVFRLPDRPGSPLSCALTFHGLSGWSGAGEDLLTKEAFADTARRLMREAEGAGLSLRVDLVQVDGLPAADADPEGEALRRRLTATLRANAYNGEGATEVGPDRFAVLRPSTASTADLDQQLREAAGGAVRPVVASLALTAASVDENIRALRYALDQYIEGGARRASIDFAAVVQKTAQEAAKLKSALASSAWSLVYQPVITLNDGALHHFEALARFEPGASPAPSICLAEELGLIADLDLAVARKVAAVLAAKPDLAIAANLSAASLMQPAFQQALAELTEADRSLRPRLLLELTETHRLTDLEAADRAIQSLRRLGHAVCLDDFGAGAASLDYLRQLEVDFIKFDGRYIRTLTAGSRDEVILKHMVGLCRELRIETIAEMVETPETRRVAEGIGVGLGQGWCFAKPSAELVYPPPAAALPARRKGVVVSWG